MAAGYTPERKPRTTEYAVAHYGFDGVCAASGREAASRGKHRRYAELIEADGEYEDFTEQEVRECRQRGFWKYG